MSIFMKFQRHTKKLLVVSLLISSASLFIQGAKAEANNVAFFVDPELIALALRAPEVIVARNRLMLSGSQIAELKASNKPKLSLSTDGNYPFSRDLSSGTPPTARSNQTYIDGIISVDVPLYDFGVLKNRVQAERDRENARRLDLQDVMRGSLFSVLQRGFIISSLQERADLITTHISRFDQKRDLAKQRYLQGAGTIVDVRELDLLSIELANSHKQVLFEIELEKQSFLDKYSVKIDTYFDAILAVSLKLQSPAKTLDINAHAKLRSFDYQIRAIEAERVSIKLSENPAIAAAVRTRLYDLGSTSGNDYDMSGNIIVRVPLFDGGLRDAQLESANIQVSIVRSQKTQEKQNLQANWNKNIASLDQQAQHVETLRERQSQMREQYDQLQKLSQTLSASFMTVAKSEFELLAVERELVERSWVLTTLELENMFLRELLRVE